MTTQDGAAIGALAAVAFSLLLAGSNAMTPIMPLYREVLGFSPATMASSFVAYVGSQVLVLLALSRIPFAKAAPAMLCAALASAAASDVLMAIATEPAILAGRALLGVACGLGTGAASVIVVALLGPRGRSVTTTGNLVGAVLGTAASQALVSSLGPSAMSWTFCIHAAACVALLTTVLLLLRRRQSGAIAAGAPPELVEQGVELPAASSLWPFVVGCVGWIGLSNAIAFAPTVFAEARLPVARDLGVIVMLVASAGGQLLSPQLARRFPWASGGVAFVAGILLVIAATALRQQAVAIVGLGMIGLGVGVGYRAALVALTRGASPARQGAIATAYAAVTYTATTISVLLAGFCANEVGLQSMALGGFAALAMAATATLARAPKLRDTLE